MKISYNKTVKRYVVSEQGRILHTTLSLGDAERLAGIEPEPLERFTPESDDDCDDVDLAELFEGLL